MSTKGAIFIIIIWLNASLMVYGHITEIILEDNPSLLPAGFGYNNVPKAALLQAQSNGNGVNEEVLYAVSGSALESEMGNVVAANRNSKHIGIVPSNTGNNLANTGGGSGIGNSGTATANTQICTVELQVLKKYPGRCVRLGKTGHGCVSGSHIIPFHSECM